jgi:hypothetical protein
LYIVGRDWFIVNAHYPLSGHFTPWICRIQSVRLNAWSEGRQDIDRNDSIKRLGRNEDARQLTVTLFIGKGLVWRGLARHALARDQKDCPQGQ